MGGSEVRGELGGRETEDDKLRGKGVTSLLAAPRGRLRSWSLRGKGPKPLTFGRISPPASVESSSFPFTAAPRAPRTVSLSGPMEPSGFLLFAARDGSVEVEPAGLDWRERLMGTAAAGAGDGASAGIARQMVSRGAKGEQNCAPRALRTRNVRILKAVGWKESSPL